MHTLYCSLPPPHNVTSVSVPNNQSELFPAVLFTFAYFACTQMTTAVGNNPVSAVCFSRGFQEYLHHLPRKFSQSMESVSPQCRCFLKLLTNRFLMFCVKKPIVLVELLLELRIYYCCHSRLVKTAKRLFAKNALGK